MGLGFESWMGWALDPRSSTPKPTTSNINQLCGPPYSTGCEFQVAFSNLMGFGQGCWGEGCWGPYSLNKALISPNTPPSPYDNLKAYKQSQLIPST